MNNDVMEDEKESPYVWARRVVSGMTRSELRALANALDPYVLLGDDFSGAAHKKRTKRGVSIADDLAARASFAKLDVPFGKRASGEAHNS